MKPNPVPAQLFKHLPGQCQCKVTAQLLLGWAGLGWTGLGWRQYTTHHLLTTLQLWSSHFADAVW